jgi:spore coat protein U-like protein
MILLGGSETMDYNLYRDGSRTLIWGDGTGGSSIVTGMGAGVTQDVTVYGRIYAGQNLVAGKYTDSITVTVEW